MIRTVTGYCRVSTEHQSAHGISLDAQRARILAWATANGHAIGGIYTDAGISGGKTANRPSLAKALWEVTRNKGILCVYSLSRLARSTKDTIEISGRLDKAQADLVSLSEDISTTGAAGKLMFRLMAVLSEFERDLAVERVTAAMTHLRGQNRRISRFCPFGFTFGPDKQLLPCPAEQDHLRTIRAMHAEGFSMSAIAESLNAKGIAAKRGGKWGKSSVHAVLTREAV